jgi:hypothetical protein
MDEELDAEEGDVNCPRATDTMQSLDLNPGLYLKNKAKNSKRDL